MEIKELLAVYISFTLLAFILITIGVCVYLRDKKRFVFRNSNRIYNLPYIVGVATLVGLNIIGFLFLMTNLLIKVL